MLVLPSLTTGTMAIGKKHKEAAALSSSSSPLLPADRRALLLLLLLLIVLLARPAASSGELTNRSMGGINPAHFGTRLYGFRLTEKENKFAVLQMECAMITELTLRYATHRLDLFLSTSSRMLIDLPASSFRLYLYLHICKIKNYV